MSLQFSFPCKHCQQFLFIVTVPDWNMRCEMGLVCALCRNENILVYDRPPVKEKPDYTV